MSKVSLISYRDQTKKAVKPKVVSFEKGKVDFNGCYFYQICMQIMHGFVNLTINMACLVVKF